MTSGSKRIFQSAAFVAALVGSSAWAQNDGKVLSFSKITSGQNGFVGPIVAGDIFGDSTTAIGDLDGNGVMDVAIGAPGADDGGLNRGAVWILFLDSTGTVIDEQKISSTTGGFGGVINNNDRFGGAVADAGDLDGDGRHELAVGTELEKLFILGLNADGTVASTKTVAAATGGFTGAIDPADRFGAVLGSAGDVNGDLIPDLAVGAPGDDDGGANRGAVWILFLNSSGTVTGQAKLSSTLGGFGAGLANSDAMGTSVKGIEDLDGNGVPELVIGAPLTNGIDQVSPGPGQPPVPTAVNDEGVVYLVFLNSNGTAASKVKIGEGSGGFGLNMLGNTQFGGEITALGDVDGNGVRDIAVGARGHQSAIGAIGAFYEIFLAANGTVVSERLVTDKQAGFSGGLGVFLVLPGDNFGIVAWVRDLDGDLLGDVIVGAPGDDTDGANAGAAWVMLLNGQEQAIAKSRNGSNVNPLVYTSTNDPRINRAWTAKVDMSGHPGATLSVIFATDMPDQQPFTFGEILISLTAVTEFVDLQITGGPIATHTLMIPNDINLAGYDVYSQGLIGGGAGPELTNAVDLSLGW